MEGTRPCPGGMKEHGFIASQCSPLKADSS